MQLLICSNVYNYVKGFKICEFNKNKIMLFNPFLTNVPLMDKPGSWFFLAKCLKNTCGRVTFQVKMQVDDLPCIFTWNFTLPQVFFKHFASKNQLPGFYRSGTLIGNYLIAWEWNIFSSNKIYSWYINGYNIVKISIMVEVAMNILKKI